MFFGISQSQPAALSVLQYQNCSRNKIEISDAACSLVTSCHCWQNAVGNNLFLLGEGILSKVVTFYKSSTGKKFVMAVTGIIGFGFVIIHMLGNLQVFLGPEKLDDYAKLLKSSQAVLWGSRSVLILAVGLHILAAFQLANMSEDARPVAYQVWKPKKSTYASRTMRWTGPILLLFIIYHLLHFTVGWQQLNLPFTEGAVYANVVAGFKLWYVSAFYVAAMLALSLHLYHGVWSLFQSIGLNHPRYNSTIRVIATVGTIVVVVGNISIPVAVFFKFIQ